MIQENSRFMYGKQEAMRIKGIAIVFMFMLHFFAHPEWILPENQYATLTTWGMSFLLVVSKFGHICVALFAFTTGYALYTQRNRYGQLKYRIKKCLQFFLQYWLVVLMFILYGLFAREPMPTIGTFLLQCLGIETGIQLKGINVCTAWYVLFYVVFLLVYPLLAKLSKRSFWSDSLLYFICLYIVSIVISKQSIIIFSQAITRFIERFGLWGTIGMIGHLFAKYEMFEKADTLLKRQNKLGWNKIKILMLMLLIGMMVVRFMMGNIAITDMIYAPVYIYTITTLCNNIKLKWIDGILFCFAKNSTYMWFVHSIFFTPNNTLQWLAYFPKHPLLILVWSLSISLLCSIVLMWCYKIVERFLFRRNVWQI